MHLSDWRKTVGYRNAGTLEFLVDADNHPYFIEMNPRISGRAYSK